MRSLWDYQSQPGSNEIESFLQSLDKLVRVRVEQKLEALAATDFEIASRTDLIGGPLIGFPHLYKMRATTKVAIRLIFCLGPVDKRAEYTLLLGAKETDGKYRPRNALKEADARRLAIEKNHALRTKRETL